MSVQEQLAAMRAVRQRELNEIKARRAADWLELQRKGWSNRRIAKHYGVHESTVRRALK